MNKPTMRKTTRDEKIVRPGVYEVPVEQAEQEPVASVEEWVARPHPEDIKRLEEQRSIGYWDSRLNDVCWHEGLVNADLQHGQPLYAAPVEPVKQEPVAWRECAFCGIEHQIKSDGYILDTKTDEVFCRKCYAHTHEQGPSKQQEALQELKEWQRAYPLSVFPEPDCTKAQQALESVGMTLDSLSASTLRWALDRVMKIVEEALSAPVRTKDLP